ncbi:hypothetical protein JD844_028844 [Phrynosoma platyrhinos]|uniref:Dynein axonemal intermediate chain 7 n=1 Tax=Phrynosoma platyrhinos TaxID=52577 RepID=A0ABQ7SIL0_PHRPL|nr:hypothetical protein JD844_028844 [Phrynosoma platyrhinos]
MCSIQDQERRGIELSELNELEESFLNASQWKMKNRALAKWEHYTGCDGSPDPMVPQEINTFMSLWQEETNNDIHDIIEKGSRVLQQASSYAESESGNMEVVIKKKKITLCVWANLKKNPRFRSQCFYDEEKKPCNGFDLPKPLAICDIAVRILHTHYDHISPFPTFPKEPPKLEMPMRKVICVSSVEKKGKKLRKSSSIVESKSDHTASRSRSFSAALACEEVKSTISVTENTEFTIKKSSTLIRTVSRAHVSSLQAVDVGELEPLEEYVVDLHQFMSVGKCWRTDDIGEVVYNMKEKEISFKMNGFFTITLLQDAHLNMPYQSWELRPTGLDEAIFNILTTFAEVQIEIKVNQCMLSTITTMEDADLLYDIRGKWMTPLALVLALKRAGMNIFPADYSPKYVSVNKKLLLAEVTTYQQMALVASAFAFSWSKWNLDSGDDNVVFKACEHLTQEPIKDEEWDLYMFSGQRAQRLEITEESKAFSKNIAEDTEFHSTLYHLIRDASSEEGMERVNHTHYLFIDAVYHLLLATRVLTYS